MFSNSGIVEGYWELFVKTERSTIMKKYMDYDEEDKNWMSSDFEDDQDYQDDDSLDTYNCSDDDDDYDDDDYDDDGFSDDTSMVMSLKNIMDCIGCEACSRVCPKKCMSHETQEIPA